MKKKVNVMYFGSEISTAFLLAKDDAFNLIAVARDPNLIKFKTLNPIDALFRTAYVNHHKEIRAWQVALCNALFQVLSFLASPLFKKYKNFLNLLIRHDIKIINTKNHDYLKRYVADKGIELFVINFWSILPGCVVRLPALGCVNIHPSQLPKYKGALPTLWALKHKDKRSAVTYMTIDETVDGGKVFSQHEFEIAPTDNILDVEHKINTIIEETFIPDLKAFLSNSLVLKEQHGEESFTERYERYRKVNFKEELAEDILNKVLSYNHSNPVVNCYVLCNGRKVALKGCHKIAADKVLLPNTYEIKGFNLYAGCKDKTLKFRLGADLDIVNFFYLFARQFKGQGNFGPLRAEVLIAS